jgi:hypothetical protein
MSKIQIQRMVETGDFVKHAKPAIYSTKDPYQLFAVHRLTYECYLSKKSDSPSLEGLWTPHPDFDQIPESTIYIAELEGKIVGSVSITMDGLRGLPLDSSFFRTCALVRTQRSRLVQLWRLLIKESCPIKDSIRELLLATAAEHFRAQAIETVLLFVQEDHMHTCTKFFEATPIALVRSIPETMDAPHVLLRCDLEKSADLPSA